MLEGQCQWQYLGAFDLTTTLISTAQSRAGMFNLSQQKQHRLLLVRKSYRTLTLQSCDSAELRCCEAAEL
ncbi:hypothetical protein EYF80_015619 [Liparis tanakae]|uniref:Uncharacterized protein n=1 Tax=Liparis tanakae TaxID=230148 RepID=A0A4Z2IA35_9TELE|nr:hypothetical protein EYF80_015619 [Liparis tanakae]